MLRDGGVLVGNVSQVGERYLVTRRGSEIQIPATNVLLVCGSLQEAYALRREKIVGRDAAAHLALAEWCLRHRLLPQAARELTDVREFDALQPRLTLLERRLAAANKPQSISQRPTDSTAIHENATTPATAPESAATDMEQLPDGVVERFTRRVQPILVNNCTVSGCHQRGGPQDFQLDRALLHGLGNRRTTRHNLAATLALVDRDQPQLSPLLAVPRQTHGGMNAPIFTPRHKAAFTHLVEWVAMVSEPEAANDSANAAAGAGQQIGAGEIAEAASSQTHDGAQSDTENLLPAQPIPPPRPVLRRGAQLEPWHPRDPFDPEIFNRAQNRQSESGGTVEANRSSTGDASD